VKKFIIIFYLILLSIFWPVSFFFANSSDLVINNDTIFTSDPLAYDTSVKKISLIPNRTFARVVQNKYTVFLDKFSNNLFINLDLNNYFFSFHPRETANYQNLNKFPFFVLPIFLFGLYALLGSPKNPLLRVLAILILGLSIFDNLDKWNIVLWPVLLGVIIKGILAFAKKYPKLSLYYFIITLPFIVFDLIRIFLLKP
jgi:hypothetical protein